MDVPHYFRSILVAVNSCLFTVYSFSNELYFGRLQIAFFSVSNEHQEQGAKLRDGIAGYCKPEQRSYWCSWPAKNRYLKMWSENVVKSTVDPCSRKCGHPLKGLSREKTPLPTKKYIFFSLVLLLSHQHSLALLSFSLVLLLSHQHSLALLSPFFAPVISFIQVSDQYFTDPHQSPIRIKTIVL